MTKQNKKSESKPKTIHKQKISKIQTKAQHKETKKN